LTDVGAGFSLSQMVWRNACSSAPNMSRDGSVETWSRGIHTEADIPASCGHHIQALFSALPYCVRAPASGGSYGRAPTSLVCLGEGKIVIINADTPASEPLVMPFVSIAAVESGRNLPLSWLALYHGGTRHVIWYNAVGYNLYEPLILAFREAHEQLSRNAGNLVADPLEPLLGLDYKYYTRSHAVLGGRMPTAYLYHPAIEIQRRLLSRRIISAYLLVAAGQPIMMVPVAASEAVAFDSFVAEPSGPSAGR